MSTHTLSKRICVHYCLLQITFWAMFMSLFGFQVVLSLDRGFSTSQAGLFTATMYVGGMIMQPILGSLLDRHRNISLKSVYCGCLLIGFVICGFFYYLKLNFWSTAGIFFLLGALVMNTYPLLDSLAMQYNNAGICVPYSLSRGLGSVSGAVISVLVGHQINCFGAQTAILTHMALMVILFLLVSTLPRCPVSLSLSQQSSNTTHSVIFILKNNKAFTFMMFGGFFGMMAVLPATSFLTTLVTNQGGTNVDLGNLLFLESVFELPSAFLFSFLAKKMKAKRILSIAVLFMMLKPILLLCSNSMIMLYLIQSVQMLGYGLFIPANVYYTNDTIPKADLLLGQSIKTVMTNSMGCVVGNILTGFVLQYGNCHIMLLICTVSGLLGVLFSMIAAKMK